MNTPTKEKRNICSSPVEKEILLLCKEKATESENYGNKFRVRHLFKSLARTSRSPPYRPSRATFQVFEKSIVFQTILRQMSGLVGRKDSPPQVSYP